MMKVLINIRPLLMAALILVMTLNVTGCRDPQSEDEHTTNEERMQPDDQLESDGEIPAQERSDESEEARERGASKGFLEHPGSIENESDEAVTNSDVE